MHATKNVYLCLKQLFQEIKDTLYLLRHIAQNNRKVTMDSFIGRQKSLSYIKLHCLFRPRAHSLLITICDGLNLIVPEYQVQIMFGCVIFDAATEVGEAGQGINENVADCSRMSPFIMINYIVKINYVLTGCRYNLSLK